MDARGNAPTDPEWAKSLKPGWQKGRRDVAATGELLGMMRQASSDEASAHVVKALNGGLSAEAVWEVLFLFAAELVLEP